MVKISFETLTFREAEAVLHVDLLRLFTTSIPAEEISDIAAYKVVDPHTIEFKGRDEEKIELRFSFLLEKHFAHLKNKLTGNSVTYIHRNSGIPLMGNVAFGIVHRGSSIIEIKPVTSCNLDCVYCSISEGLSSTKHDFVVEEEYLVEEVAALVEKINESVEIHIGVQGEPFLYADMELLISDLQKMPLVHTISIDTNGTLLNKPLLDRLAVNTKLQINMSLDAIDEGIAKEVAGTAAYNVKHVQDMISYAAQRIKVIVAPVLTQGYNDNEMEKIIAFIKSLPVQPILGIQNFLRYKTGRNAAKEISWDAFYALLDRLEKKYDIKLRLQKEDFNIRKIADLEKPFNAGDVVNAVVKCPDRFPNSVIAVSGTRNISVPGCEFRKDKKIKVEIVRDKHNIFTGKLV